MIRKRKHVTAGDPTRPGPEIVDGEPVDESELYRSLTQMLGTQGAEGLFETLEERRVLRGRRLFQLSMRHDLIGALDESLLAVRRTASFLRESSVPDLVQVAVLADRVRGDAEQAVDSLLDGVRAVVSDAMRDVMEAELLIRRFALDPTVVSVWSSADDATLRNAFGPGQVRSALAKAAGLGEAEHLPDGWEYEIHSRLLHASPHQHAADLKRPSDTFDDLAPMTSEIVGHLTRFLDACTSLYDELGVDESGRPDLRLPVVGELLANTTAMQRALPFVPPRVPMSRQERRAHFPPRTSSTVADSESDVETDPTTS